MSYQITKKDLRLIEDWSAIAAPRECCGLLVRDKTIRGVDRLIPILCKNYASNPLRSFRVIGADIDKIISKPETLIGCFHSHPKTIAYPTTSDKKNNFPTSFLYLIYSHCYKETGLFIFDQYNQTQQLQLHVI